MLVLIVELVRILIVVMATATSPSTLKDSLTPPSHSIETCDKPKSSPKVVFLKDREHFCDNLLYSSNFESGNAIIIAVRLLLFIVRRTKAMNEQ